MCMVTPHRSLQQSLRPIGGRSPGSQDSRRPRHLSSRVRHRKNYSSAAPEQLTQTARYKGHVEILSKFPSQARQPKQNRCTLSHSTTSKSTTEIDLRNRVHHHVEIESRTSKPNCRRTCIHCRTKRGNRRVTLSQATIQPNSHTYQWTASNSSATENRAPRGLHLKSAPTETV